MEAKEPSDDGQMKPTAFSGVEAATTYYFISDLHIGGDGALDQCDFEAELILAIPLYLLARDIRGTIRRYGIEAREGLKFEKEAAYIAAAKTIFERDPAVLIYIYGHTHIPSMRKVDSRYVINTGTWLKRLDRVPASLRLVPDVYVPSYRLNYFTVKEELDGIRVSYQILAKEPTDDLSWLEKVMFFGRHKTEEEQIPSETLIDAKVKRAGVGEAV